MNKFLKLSTVSILAIVATANAYAAGYTCEELIEYTSCNPGYYLSSGANCPSGYDFVSGFCGGPGDGLIYSDVTEEECYTRVSEDWGEDITSDPEGYGIYHIQYACVSRENSEEYYAVSMSSQCLDCPIGSTCAGGTAGAKLCTKGSYCAGTNLTQPTGTCTSGTFAPEGSVSCISCPEHKYVNSTGQTISVSATSAAGAGSVTECVIDSNKTFTDIKGTYKFREDCAYDIQTMQEAFEQIKKTDGTAYCEDDMCWCDGAAMEVMIYEPLTGAAVCMSNEWPDGNDYTISDLKSACSLSGGIWNVGNITCDCPSGTDWVADEACDFGACGTKVGLRCM